MSDSLGVAPCIFVPWLAPAVCPELHLLHVCLLDLRLPTAFSCAEIPLFSPNLPLSEEGVKQYIQQIQAVSEDPHAISANMFTHLTNVKPFMPRNEQQSLNNFVATHGKESPLEGTILKAIHEPIVFNPSHEAVHRALLCAALSQSQQTEMAVLMEKYHAALKQFTTSIHGETCNAEALNSIEISDTNKVQDAYSLQNELAMLDTTKAPMNWRTILEYMALFVPKNTIFVLDSASMPDLPDSLHQALPEEFFDRLPRAWSQATRDTLHGNLCTLRHVLDTDTKVINANTALDHEYLFILHPLT